MTGYDPAPRLCQVIEGLHFIIPLAILIYVLVANYSPMRAGFVAVLSTFAASLVANAVRWTVSANQLSTDDPARKSLYDFRRN